jgi:Fur family zinc uptake transcriptional regulator
MAHSHEDHHHARPRELTRNQGLVLGALHHADAPLSAYDILDRLRAEGLRAPLQVYRALEKLIDAGLAHRLESLNAFVCCADARGHRSGLTGFAICEKCGRVDEFSDDVVKERLGAWAAAHRFSAERTTIELRGTCAACAAS